MATAMESEKKEGKMTIIRIYEKEFLLALDDECQPTIENPQPMTQEQLNRLIADAEDRKRYEVGELICQKTFLSDLLLIAHSLRCIWATSTTGNCSTTDSD